MDTNLPSPMAGRVCLLIYWMVHTWIYMGVSEVMGDPQVTTGFNTVGLDHHWDDHWGTPIDWKPPHRHHDILGSSSISRLFSTGKK